ncbi:MAG: type II secretion system protein GspD [Spirochaetales bacterium]
MKRIIIAMLLGALLVGHAPGQSIDRLEFYSMPIAEILVALGAATGNAVIPDQSVTGTTSYFVQDTSFERALETFARNHDLFVRRENGLYLVSRMQVLKEESGFSVTASAVSTRALFRALFEAATEEVQYLSERDPVIGPLDFTSKSLAEVTVLIASQANMQVEIDGGVYYVWDRDDKGQRGRATTTVIEPNHLSVESIAALLPWQLAKQASIRTDFESGLMTVSGPEAVVNQLVDHIAKLDRPSAMITYQLLIVEYYDRAIANVGSTFASQLTGPDSVQAFVGAIGPLLTLDFRVLSAFGYEFALELAAKLESSQARVVMDATLQGIAGQPVRFASQEVRRLVSLVSSGSEGSERTEMIEEVAAGLETEITARVSGDNELLVHVNVSASRFESTEPGSAGAPTSLERLVETTVRGESGVPIALTAYVEEQSGVESTAPPLLSRIPLLRRLVGTSSDGTAAAELGIYVIPRVAETTGIPNMNAELMGLYERHVEAGDARR